VTSDYIALHPNGSADYDGYRGILRREAEASGARYIDVGTWPVEFFSDPIHVNGKGSARLTALFDDVIHELQAS
jgi:hypothetical protein